MATFKLWGALTSVMLLLSAMATLATGLPNLRIMPLGDSITKGSGSSDGNGYRNRLRQKLLNHADISVDMIGSLKLGNMADNDNEGHSGKFLADIDTYWQLSIRARPNVVLVLAGTNNMDLEIDLADAADIMKDIIDGIFTSAPDTVVLVAPVIWANDARMQENTDRFNLQLASIIKTRQDDDKHILSVPIDINIGDLSDKKHPDDGGYEKMAVAWLNGILEADDRGWIKTPISVSAADLPGMGLGTSGSGGEGEICKDGFWKRQGTVFDGFRIWDDLGTIRGPVENGRRDKVILADLNGDGIADYILADDDGTVRAWINGGEPNQWTSLGKVNPDWSTITGDMIRLADVDNDGKADLIALYQDGAAKVWKNTDNGRKFEALDSKWATGLESRDKIHFEDVDGDGYADYVIIYNDGAVKWARNSHNNGKDDRVRNWEIAVAIAPGPAGVPDNRARLVDLDGDRMADYLVVYDGGAVKAFRNTGSLNGVSRNWDDLGTIAPGVSGVTGDMIRFADMDGDGQTDFLAVSDDGSVRMWRNLGIVGTKGTSMRFADLTGDGKADIISVDDKGRARAWFNKGGGKWEETGQIAPGLDEDLSSARIEFADVNGDGLADFLVIYGGGAVKAYLNNANLPYAGKSRIWQEAIVISNGVGEPGRKVRFADLNGDGYADYIVLYDGGAAKAWLNNQNIPPKDGGRIWQEGYTVATGVGQPGSKIRFADLTGDGRAEYIVQYDGGAADAYRNMGNIPDAGMPRNFNDMGTVAAGVTPQGPVRYADIDGDGKVDYLVVFNGGAVNAYMNVCDWDAPPPDDGDDGDDGDDDGGDGDDGDDDGGDDDDGDDDGNICREEDGTFSSQDPSREGEYMLWDLLTPADDGEYDTGVRYVTIVNLTPHPFHITGSSHYQIDIDFDDIPQGTSRQNVATYSTDLHDTFNNDNAEIYYSVGDTGKKFVVRVTTNDKSPHPRRVVFDLDGMGRGQREYKIPGREIPVTLVITGSDSFGFIASLSHGPGNWMHSIKDQIKDRRLVDVVMPGTHDSGMSKLTAGILSGGSKENTQTQGLGIYDQLRAGARWFDLRIASVHRVDTGDDRFYVMHVSDETAEVPIGRTGLPFSEVTDDINQFTSDNPGEIIILQFRYLIGIRNVPSFGPIYWEDDMKNTFFDELKRINNRCPDISYTAGDTMEQANMGDLMAKNDGKGCVLLFLDTQHLEKNIAEKDRYSEEDGIYTKTAISWTDAWPNKDKTEAMAEWAVDGWQETKNFYVAQWLCTTDYLKHPFASSIQQIAILPTNPALYWRGVNEMSPTIFPNVLMVDYIGMVLVDENSWHEVSAELYTLAIGMNLYMISENCKINKKRSPLLPSKSRASSRAAVAPNPLVSSWNGIIFANGTKVDNPPPGLHPGRVEVYKKGTVFSNGTVLDKDTPNPDVDIWNHEASNATWH